ncbi:MAG: DUF2250 domain-containing protein [Conexivisphaera sp.]
MTGGPDDVRAHTHTRAHMHPLLPRVLSIPGALGVLRHLRRAHVDYGRSVAASLRTSIEAAVSILESLESMGLVERVPGSSVKRSDAKMKLADEVHKHHTYYRLSREGDALLRSLDDRALAEGYARALDGDELAFALLHVARRIGVDHALTYAKLVGRPLEQVEAELERLVGMGLMEIPRNRVVKRGDRKAKPKPETRVHHRYYALSREGDLLLRSMGASDGAVGSLSVSGSGSPHRL